MSNDSRIQKFANDLAIMVARDLRDENGLLLPHATPFYVGRIVAALRATADYTEVVFAPIDRERSEQGRK